MRNYFIIFLLIWTTTTINSCQDLARDNPLDPKNPDAETNQITLIENFIVTNTKVGAAFPVFTQNSLDALYQLKGTYGDKIAILEYHMTPSDPTYADSFAVWDSTTVKTRYNDYRGSQNRGFPHTFFNGFAKSVQGASAKETVASRYNEILDPASLNKSTTYLTLSKSWSGNTLTIDGKLAQYGSKDLPNVQLEYIVYEDLGSIFGHYSVRKILTPHESISSVTGGDIINIPTKTVDLPSHFDHDKIGVIVLIRDTVSKKIIQSNIAK